MTGIVNSTGARSGVIGTITGGTALDYETGTFGGTGANDALFNNTYGGGFDDVTCGTYGLMNYTKIGNTCFVRGNVAITASGTPSGDPCMVLPFTNAAGVTTRVNRTGCGILTYSVDFAGGATAPAILTSPGSAYAFLLASGDTLTHQICVFAVGDQFMFGFNYLV